MQKETIIQQIEQAEKYHRIQYKKLKNMLAGIETTKPTPLNKEECDFGKWLYPNSHLLQELLGTQFYEKLEAIHTQWYAYYLPFYDLYYTKTKGGFFSKEKIVFHKIDGDAQEKAKNLFQEIEKTTQELLQHIDVCKKRVYALQKDHFETLKNQA